jgi:hypothetical protein
MRREEGVALVLALGILVVLSMTVTTLLYSATSNERAGYRSKADQIAFALAEAGINNSMSVLANPANNALNSTLLPNRTSQYEGGTVEWSGVLDQPNAVWTLTAIGRTRGGVVAKRQLNARVPVYPTFTQPLNNPAWNYIYSRGTGNVCDMTIGQTVNILSPLYVEGNLCLQNQARISSGPLTVFGSLTMSQNANAVGSAAAPLVEARIRNGCKWTNNPSHNPCRNGSGASGNDNVWATVLNNQPVTTSPPVPLWDDWYLNASPGPYYPCTSPTGIVPTFDTDQGSVPDLTRRNNSVAAVFNLTPASAYSCRTAGGELSWDPVTRVLTANGTIFIDGSVKVENGLTNTYTGSATLYVSGTALIKNSKLCVVVSGSNCTVSGWNPNGRMLVIVANGQGGQVPADTSVQLVSAHFQGAIYATAAIDVSTTSLVDGPLDGAPVKLGQSSGSNFPGFTIVPVGMPGNPAVYAQPGTPQIYG